MLISLRSRQPDETGSLLESDRWDISIATSHDNYPASKLQTDNIDDATKTWGQRQSHTRIEASASNVIATPIDYVGVVGINRRAPYIVSEPGITVQHTLLANQARLIVDTYPESVHNPKVVTSGFSTTNLTAVYGTPNFAGGVPAEILNQPLNPPEIELSGGYLPGAFEAANNTLQTSITVNFNNNSARPLAGGTELQEIHVHVRNSVNKEVVPTVSGMLRQAGVDVSTIGSYSRVEKTSEGYIYVWKWDADLLPNKTGQVGLRLTGFVSGGTSTVEFMAIEFRSTVTGALYDSGWGNLARTDLAVWAPQISVPAFNSFYVIVQFSDLGKTYTILDGAFTVTIYNTLAAEFNAGRFAAGPAIDAPLRAFNLRKVGNNQGNLVPSYGGFLRAARVDLTRWEADFKIIPQSQSRVFSELEEFFQAVGYILPALYIPDIPPANEQAVNALWAILTSYDAPDLGLLKGYDKHDEDDFSDERFDLQLTALEAQALSTRRGE